MKLKKTLDDKEKEVHQAKEVAVLEYRDSDALIAEVGVSYNDGFDDTLRQAKALYPKLDFSSVNISVPKPTSVHPEQSEDPNELFGEEVLIPNAPVVLTVEGESRNEEARQARQARHICRHLFFAYLLKLLLMQPHYSVGILLGMCLSVLFKNVFSFRGL